MMIRKIFIELDKLKSDRNLFRFRKSSETSWLSRKDFVDKLHESIDMLDELGSFHGQVE